LFPGFGQHEDLAITIFIQAQGFIHTAFRAAAQDNDHIGRLQIIRVDQICTRTAQ
jgi:hypothetical protein